MHFLYIQYVHQTYCCFFLFCPAPVRSWANTSQSSDGAEEKKPEAK